MWYPGILLPEEIRLSEFFSDVLTLGDLAVD